MPRLNHDVLSLAGLSLVDGRRGKRRKPFKVRYVFVEGAHTEAPIERSSTEDSAEPVKRKKSRNANRNKNRKTPVVVEQEEVTKERVCKISWGDVNHFYFKRAVGYGTVPSKGAYPLGFGAEEETMREKVSIDSHQNTTEAILLVRAHQLGVPVPPAPKEKGKEEGRWIPLETRQLDYKKSGNINPLFGPLSEEDRIVMLGATIRGNKSRSSSVVDPGSAEERGVKNRSGSLVDPPSADLTGDDSSSSNDKPIGGDGADSSDEPPSIAELNKELSRIRHCRETSMGCNCRPIKIDKLSLVKMKAELVENKGILCKPTEVESLSKVELTSLLKEKLKFCPLCVENNCACVQMGIECRADTCECLRRTGGPQHCANPAGRTGFDSGAVHQYRLSVLEKM